MKEVGTLAIDLEALTIQPEQHGYAFAAWRFPDSSEKQLIIDLDEPKALNGSFKHTETGFLVNKFTQHHPSQPLNIKADIRIDLPTSKTTLHPRVNATKVDIFLEKLKEFKKPLPTASTETCNNAYEQLVANAVEKITEGHLTKVVLSRFKDEALGESFSTLDFFEKVCEANPRAFCSLFFLPGEGIWIGASPEILIDSTERMFKTVSLAGTKRLKNGASLGDISWTQKEIEEQALVSRYIINCFKKLRLREFDEYGPKTTQAGNLLHLKTEFQVDLSAIAFDGLGDQMMELLHPTSAVCGMPLQKALDYILKNEGFDRSFFSGFLGPVNDEGHTRLFVNLRCMNVNGSRARFYAGAGITGDSNPHKEFLETEMKMDVLLHLLKA